MMTAQAEQGHGGASVPSLKERKVSLTPVPPPAQVITGHLGGS